MRNGTHNSTACVFQRHKTISPSMDGLSAFTIRTKRQLVSCKNWGYIRLTQTRFDSEDAPAHPNPQRNDRLTNSNQNREKTPTHPNPALRSMKVKESQPNYNAHRNSTKLCLMCTKVAESMIWYDRRKLFAKKKGHNASWSGCRMRVP